MRMRCRSNIKMNEYCISCGITTCSCVPNDKNESRHAIDCSFLIRLFLFLLIVFGANDIKSCVNIAPYLIVHHIDFVFKHTHKRTHERLNIHK